MKFLIHLSIVVFSFGAHANTSPCTTVLNEISTLTTNYIDLYKMCMDEAPDSELYLSAQGLAKEVEAAYGRANDRCHRVCSATIAKRSCTFQLSGACP